MVADSQRQYIERLTTLLSKGLVCLWLQSAEARGCVVVLGGGRKTGKGFVEAWWESTNGAVDSRPVSPLGRERL